MSGYKHGISVTETPAVEPVILSQSGIQVAIGTAPIHLSKNPSAAVNKIIVAYSLEEVKEKLGYSNDYDKYTLNQTTFASFEHYKVAPVIYINVLDPEKHIKEGVEKTVTLSRLGAEINEDGVLLDTVVVKDETGATTYVKDVDYVIAFNAFNVPVINAVKTSLKLTNTSKVKVTFNQLDPSLVSDADIIGGYDSDTGVATGIELIRKIYPKLSLRPEILVAPGFSHHTSVGAVLESKTEKINESFNAKTFLDIDTSVAKKYEDAIQWKTDNYYRDMRSVVLWPKVKRDGRIFYYSAFLAAYASRMVADDDDGIPYQSPSNKRIRIDALVLEDGSEVNLEMPQANTLNENGIVTAILWGGAFRSWGNNTAVYPESKAAQNRFIPVRSVLDWWGNTFIEKFFDKVDDPTNYRLIESIVDSENARANDLAARGKIAGAKMVFLRSDNPTSQILDGKIKFKQYIGAFGPAEYIENELEFDPTFIETALFGEGN